jgi:hypothetical protein
MSGLNLNWLIGPPSPALPPMSARSAMRVLPGLVQLTEDTQNRKLELAGAMDEWQTRSAARSVLPGLLSLDPLDPQYGGKMRDVLGANPTAMFDRNIAGLLGMQSDERRYDQMYGGGADAKLAVNRDRERRAQVRQIAMDTDDWSLHNDYNALVTEGFDPDEAMDYIADQAALRASVLKQAVSGVPENVLLEDPEVADLVQSNKQFAGKLKAATTSVAMKTAKDAEVSPTQQATVAQALKKAIEDMEAEGNGDPAVIATMRTAYTQAMKKLADSVNGGTGKESLGRYTGGAPAAQPSGGGSLTRPRG